MTHELVAGSRVRVFRRAWSYLRAAYAAAGKHWPEYLMEAGCVVLLMISACSLVILFQHPSSPAREMIQSALLRRIFIGLGMGVTVILLIYSPWGKRSGAHLSPSTTLTYFRLGKVEAPDAVFYILAQFVGGVIGVMISAGWWGELIANMDVRYAATVPGAKGIFVAFVAELAISFVLMTVILNASNSARVMRFTGILAGTLVATYISLEAPFSGMSMNPARTFASAFSGRIWDAIWIYFSAPPLGMLLAAELYVWRRGTQAVLCAKLYHTNDTRCIFNCSYKALFPKLTLKEISQ